MAKLKLTPELQHKVVAYLESGVTVENICDAIGIHKSTYYDWIKQGEGATRKTIYSDFSDAVTQARGSALLRAEQVARGGLETQDEHLQSVDEVTEIRLRTVQRLDENGKVVIEKVPYEYRKLTKRTQKRTIAPSPDYAIKYLSRRDPAKWAETQKINIGVDVKVLAEAVEALESLGQDPAAVFNEIIARAKLKQDAGS